MYGQHRNTDKDEYRADQTTSLNGGRWEFLMSTFGGYKIDKFTGEVYLLVQKKEDYTMSTWQIVPKLEKKDSRDIQKEDCINYQLYSTGRISFEQTYLLNTNTGLTWKRVVDKNGMAWFQLLE
jgi:hypothetical protein